MVAAPTAALAAHRFGLGPRPGDLAGIDDPLGWLDAQIADPQIPDSLSSGPDLPTRARMAEAARIARNAGEMPVAGTAPQDLYLGDARVRTAAALASAQPFVERWVRFWSNRLTVSQQQFDSMHLIGPYEAQVIRPHCFGSFADLLVSALRHPALLVYLNNAQSFGPNSETGKRRNRGLNENTGREALELWTVGLAAGYTQADVTELSRVLTGWTVRGKEEEPPGTFIFRPGAHEPGAKTVLGRSYTEGGEAEGERALRDLATDRFTAASIATALVRHFIADEPPAGAVARLTETFHASGGDLAAVARALIRLQEAWNPAPGKARTTEEWVLAAFRASGADPAAAAPKAVDVCRQLGQQVWAAPSPAGWPDASDTWLAPDSLLLRLDAARVVASQAAPASTAAVLSLLAGTASPATLAHVGTIKNPKDALTVALVAPEFHRR